jgi:hypothetical protein
MPNGKLNQLNRNGVTIYKKGEPHGNADFTKETLMLFYWDGNPESEIVE